MANMSNVSINQNDALYEEYLYQKELERWAAESNSDHSVDFFDLIVVPDEFTSVKVNFNELFPELLEIVDDREMSEDWM